MFGRVTAFLTLRQQINVLHRNAQAFTAIGGVPHLLVPENTETAVIKACIYDPRVNRTYAEMARPQPDRTRASLAYLGRFFVRAPSAAHPQSPA
jgi:hypothetical protein